MSTVAKLALVALALVIPAAAQAKEKIKVGCFYESGTENGKPISRYNIVNMHGPSIPKGTVVSFSVAGKTYTVTAPKDIEAMDDFSTGGTYPMGSCDAWWEK
jgi:hypothetical protein